MSNLYVGAFYRPPDSDNPDYLAQLDTCLSRIPADRFLQQLVSQPTRITETTENSLDLSFCNNSSLGNTVEVITGISDHEAVYIEASLRPHKTPKPPRTVFCYNQADYESVKTGLHTLHRDMSTMLSAPVDKLWTLFKTASLI